MAIGNGVNTPGLSTTGGANEYQIGGAHYRKPIQHWDYVVANNMPYLEAQVTKYLTRWREKGGHQDLRKAKHYLQKLFEVEGVDWATGDNIAARKEAHALREHAQTLDRIATGGPAEKACSGVEWAGEPLAAGQRTQRGYPDVG